MEQLELKASRVDFTAHRDAAGVPHATCGSWLEAVYALGYLHALDRPTQMHFACTVAAGRGAELIANRPQMLEVDRFLRRSGVHLRMSEEVGMLAPRILEQLEWYCRGVNDGLEEIGKPAVPRLLNQMYETKMDSKGSIQQLRRVCQALEMITGQRFGFTFDKPGGESNEEIRISALRQWYGYWSSHHDREDWDIAKDREESLEFPGREKKSDSGK